MIVSLAFVATLIVPATALSDGDPASDVLLAQRVFYPYSPSVSAGLQKTLNAETAAASRALPNQGGADRHAGRSRSDPDPVRQAAAVRRLP